MDITSAIQNHNNYIRENNYKKSCGINLYCCELNFYRNATHYLQQFVCYIYKS